MGVGGRCDREGVWCTSSGAPTAPNLTALCAPTVRGQRWEAGGSLPRAKPANRPAGLPGQVSRGRRSFPGGEVEAPPENRFVHRPLRHFTDGETEVGGCRGRVGRPLSQPQFCRPGWLAAAAGGSVYCGSACRLCPWVFVYGRRGCVLGVGWGGRRLLCGLSSGPWAPLNEAFSAVWVSALKPCPLLATLALSALTLPVLRIRIPSKGGQVTCPPA